MKTIRNINLPTFTTNTDDLDRLDGQSKVITIGLLFYWYGALAMNGVVTVDADGKACVGDGTEAKSLNSLWAGYGKSASVMSKVGIIFRHYHPDFIDYDAATMREATIAVVNACVNPATGEPSVNYGHAVVEGRIDPETELEIKGAPTPKTVQELLATAARRAVDNGVSDEDFLTLALEAYKAVQASKA